jgi:hypothetical protein
VPPEDSARGTGFAYLLLTHKGSAHVEELATRILSMSPRAQIVVHHDAASEDVPWGAGPPEQIHLVERSRVLWGDWTMVETTLRLLRFARANLDAEWFVLLSGEHRPATDLLAWELVTAESGVDAYVAAEQLPKRLRFGKTDFERNQYLARSLHRWMTVPRPRSDLLHRAMGAAMKASSRMRPLLSVEFAHRRDAWAVGFRRPLGRRIQSARIYRGSQWLAVNRRGAEALLRQDPEMTAWFRRSWIPDEAYLQTALHATPGLIVSEEPTTFVLDTPARPVPGWMRLSMADLPAVWASHRPFCRKVDADERPEVMAAIDRVVDDVVPRPEKEAGCHVG